MRSVVERLKNNDSELRGLFEEAAKKEEARRKSEGPLPMEPGKFLEWIVSRSKELQLDKPGVKLKTMRQQHIEWLRARGKWLKSYWPGRGRPRRRRRRSCRRVK